jgi:hypothetical protein
LGTLDEKKLTKIARQLAVSVRRRTPSTMAAKKQLPGVLEMGVAGIREDRAAE